MRRPAFLILATGLFGAMACDSERAIGNDPVGDPAYGIRLAQATANVPQGTVQFRVSPAAATTARDTVRLTLRGLDSLAGDARYTLWIRDADETGFQRFPARITMTHADTSINAQGDPVVSVSTVTLPSASSFSNGGPRTSFFIEGALPTTGFPAGARPALVLVTIEESDAATEPSATRRPLWAQRTAFTAPGAAVANNAGVVRFGFWSDEPTEQYIYVVGAQRGRAVFRGNVLVVNDSSLPRPPRGYYYAAYLVKRDDSNTPIDTVYLGPQTSPAPRRDVSLFHADSLIIDPLVQVEVPPQILAASSRVVADTTGGLEVNVPFRGIADVLVTLELKDFKIDEERLGPSIVLRADVPTIVRFGPAP